MGCLYGILFAVVAVLAFNKFKLYPKMGGVMACMYFVYVLLVYTLCIYLVYIQYSVFIMPDVYYMYILYVYT